MRAYVSRTSCGYKIFYFSLSFFLALFVSHNTHKGIIPKEISRIHAEELATFFIPSRSRNVHFSPGALMQHRRGRRRFIAVLTFPRYVSLSRPGDPEVNEIYFLRQDAQRMF